MNYIKIDRYDTRVIDGEIRYFAVSGKKEYEMPPCYKEMYDNHHLAIAERTIVFPEVFDLPEVHAKHWIPLNTTEVFACPKKAERNTTTTPQ